MMLHDMTYEDALAKSEHLIALGETTVYLRGETPKPWMVAQGVESGGGYRLNGPSGVYIIAKVQGLTFKWNVDFEGQGANGRGVSLFDRDRLREVMRKLPTPARKEFAKFLRDQVLPSMKLRTAELREALNSQCDSEDCVTGLIAYADEKQAA